MALWSFYTEIILIYYNNLDSKSIIFINSKLRIMQYFNYFKQRHMSYI